MAHPYMSQKDLPNYGAVNVVPASPLPAYYVTPAPPPRRGYTFLKTLVVALALLEAGRLGYQWHQREWHRRHGHVHVPGWDIDIDMRGIDHGAEGCAVWDHYDPDHPSLNVDDQASGNDYKHLDNRDKFSFSIPTSSERYHFVSWGPIDKSQFEVIPVESDKEQIVVEVDIVKDSRNSARVCALPSTGESGVYGVGIYSPRHHDPYPVRDWPAFGIKVFIPVSSDGSQRQLNALETRLGQFEHVFPDLSETINFSKLRLSAANVPMTFGSVVANWVKVSNANGPIEGTFTSATDLALVNANSKVIGNLTLTQAGKIFVGNANSDVDLVVHLKSGDFHPRPDYYITLENAKAPIGITIAEQPVGSGFFLKASNAASSVRAHLHAAYEGRFRLSDVMRVPSVEVTNHKDPAGRGRERYLQFEKTGWTTTGRVEWGSPDDAAEHAPGEVNISTVMAPIELFFD